MMVSRLNIWRSSFSHLLFYLVVFCILYSLELYTGVGILVGIGRYFVGIMIPIPTENLVGRFQYYKLGGSLKKLAGAPFFQRRRGPGTLFVFALLLKKKRNSRGIYKKRVPANS